MRFVDKIKLALEVTDAELGRITGLSRQNIAALRAAKDKIGIRGLVALLNAYINEGHTSSEALDLLREEVRKKK